MSRVLGALCTALMLSLSVPSEIFPYLVVVIGLENVLVLTKSVVSTPVDLEVKLRIAQGNAVGLGAVLYLVLLNNQGVTETSPALASSVTCPRSLLVLALRDCGPRTGVGPGSRVIKKANRAPLWGSGVW